ncbi:MAG: hypothetical protein EHM34_06955 [Nitrosopumilales archaeon]|nr:MAG: hypothetical protein EHM34_06955 [Nitrosopumilales archaeon]
MIATDLDITVMVLPPKTVIDMISDWIQKNPGLAQILTAIIVGVLSTFLILVMDKRRHQSKIKYQICLYWFEYLG